MIRVIIALIVFVMSGVSLAVAEITAERQKSQIRGIRQQR